LLAFGQDIEMCIPVLLDFRVGNLAMEEIRAGGLPSGSPSVPGQLSLR
jgi:hypothetical protein